MSLFGKKEKDSRSNFSNTDESSSEKGTLESEITLKVASAYQRDVGRGIVRISRKVMGKIGTRPGDVVEIIGTKNTAAVVWPAYPEDENFPDIIRMDGTIRKNAGVGLGDKVTIRKTEIKEAKKVVLAPIEPIHFGSDFINWLHSRLIKRAVVRGDYIEIGILGQELTFVVTATTPSGVVQITEITDLTISERSSRYIKPEKNTYVNLQKYVEQIIILYLKGIPDEMQIPTTGILLYSEPKSGNETFFISGVIENLSLQSKNYFLLNIQAAEIMSFTPEEGVKLLENTFKTAIQKAPAIIVIDNLHLMAPKRENAGEFEKRILYKLLTLLEEVRKTQRVIVLSTTDNLESIDPEVLSVFDEIIQVPSLDEGGRLEALKIYARRVPLASDVSLVELSKKTEGYSLRDLRNLLRKAIINAAKRRGLQEIQHYKDIMVTMEDFQNALKEINIEKK